MFYWRVWSKIRPRHLFCAVLLVAFAAMAANGPGVKTVSYDRMAEQSAKPELSQVVLNPERGWTNSKVFLGAGDLVNISADGLIDPGVRLSRGPDGMGADPLKEMTHSCPYMSLLGRMGDGQEFCVGANATFEVLEGGQLSFHVNELDVLRYDDLGHFNIDIRVIKPGQTTTKPQPAQPVLAVLPLVPVNMTALEAQGLSTVLRSRLGQSGKYIVMDQGQVDKASASLGYGGADLTKPNVAQNIGRAAGAQQVVFGQIALLAPNRYTVTLQRLAVASGKVENTVVETLECPPEKLAEKLALIADKI